MYLDRKGSNKHVTGEKALLMVRVYNFKKNTKIHKIRRKITVLVFCSREHIRQQEKGKQKNTYE